MRAPTRRRQAHDVLHADPGQPSSLRDRPCGCPFSRRCVGFEPGAVRQSRACRGNRAWASRSLLPPSQNGRCSSRRRRRWIASPAEPSAEVVLRAQGLSKVYGGSSFFGAKRGAELSANEDLNFEAKKSEIIAIVGESGSGSRRSRAFSPGCRTRRAASSWCSARTSRSASAENRSSDQLSAVQWCSKPGRDAPIPRIARGSRSPARSRNSASPKAGRNSVAVDRLFRDGAPCAEPDARAPRAPLRRAEASASPSRVPSRRGPTSSSPTSRSRRWTFRCRRRCVENLLLRDPEDQGHDHRLHQP